MKELQTLEPVRKFLESYFKRNSNATLKTLFKQVRLIEKVSFIGDWPIINEIVFECAKRNVFFEASEVCKVMRSSDDEFLKKQRIDSQLVAILSNKEELKARISAD